VKPSQLKHETQLLDALLRELYASVDMPGLTEDTETLLGQISACITTVVRGALDSEFLPSSVRVAQFVSVPPSRGMPPSGQSITLPEPAVVPTRADRCPDDLLRRFAYVTHYNARHDFSFLSLTRRLGMHNAIMLISGTSLASLAGDAQERSRRRDAFSMSYSTTNNSDVSFLDKLVVAPHFVEQDRTVDIGGVLHVPTHLDVLNRSAVASHDPEIPVRLEHAGPAEPRVVQAVFTKFAQSNREYHARMSALAHQAHVVLCAPEAAIFAADRNAVGSSGLNVLFDASMPLDWDAVERCYLLAYKLTAVVANVRDLIRVSAANRSLRQYAMTAHNLQGKVANARIHLSAVGDLPPDQRDVQVEKALVELIKLNSFVKSVLECYAAETLPIERTRVDSDLWKAIRQECDDLTQRRARERKRELKIDLGSHDPLLVDSGHIGALEVIVSELLRNAERHLDESIQAAEAPASSNADIQLRAIRSKGSVQIDVLNGGRGLSQQEVDTLNRVEPSEEAPVRKSSDHYGLGVASCKFIANRLNKSDLTYSRDSRGRTVARLVYWEADHGA